MRQKPNDTDIVKILPFVIKRCLYRIRSPKPFPDLNYGINYIIFSVKDILTDKFNFKSLFTVKETQSDPSVWFENITYHTLISIS